MKVDIIKHHFRSSVLNGVIVVIIAATSCRKQWLDKKQNKNLSTIETLADMQAVLDFTATMNNYAASLGEIASDGHYVNEAAWVSSTSAAARNAYTCSHDQPYKNVASWNGAYRKIFADNLILESIDNDKLRSRADLEIVADLKGQALFNRSEAFFQLSNIYTPQYTNENKRSMFGLPLRLTSDVSEKSFRSTNEETHDRIKNDLLQALELLPMTSRYLTRASKVAAYGLLARVYLSEGDYTSAWRYSNMCLMNKNDLIDFNTLDTNANYIGLFNKEVLYHNQMYTYDLDEFLGSSCLVERTLYDLYDDNDLRKYVFFNYIDTNKIIFSGNYHNNNRDIFSGLAVDEVFLIRAECSARLGKREEAISDLNTLLASRWKSGTFIPFTSFNDENVLQKIFIERKKELLFRGLRWMDLRRLNLHSNSVTTLNRFIGGKVYVLEPNSSKYTFPIPDDIIEQSSLTQNEGW